MRSRFAYALTFLTYALIHSVRTSWSFIKPYMQQQPFLFSTQFLGELDLTILISLAVSLNTIGWVGEKIGSKLFLLLGMSYLAVLALIISILIVKGIVLHWVYIFLLCMTGISMCTGWPSCLSIVSKYYSPLENSFLICIWNGCSQLGDLIAVFLGYAVIQWGGSSPGFLIFSISILLFLMILINMVFLSQAPQLQDNQVQIKSESSKAKDQKQDVANDKHEGMKQVSGMSEQQQKSSQSHHRSRSIQSVSYRPRQQPEEVNFLNVWCLPSVPSYVCCYACLKAINAIIMNWLFMYLYSIGLNKLSGIITLGWSVSIFVGNLLMGYYNKSTNKIGLLIPLLFTAFVFGYLGVEYQHSGSINYAVLLILSGICFGGPFGLIGSKVALILGEHPEIKPKKNALGAIISLMEGFGQFVSAFFVLIIPYLGLRRLFYLPTLLCMISASILFYEHKKGLVFSKKENMKRRELELKGLNENI